jgi:hypothetical protein
VSRNLPEHVYQNQQQQYHRVEMIISQNCNTPITNTSSHRHPYTPNSELLNIETGSGHAVVAHPRQHRRSRSLSEIWLEHRPQGTIQTGLKNKILFKKKNKQILFEYRNSSSTKIS